MKIIAYVLVAIAVAGLLYLGSVYLQTSTVSNAGQHSTLNYGIFNDTVVSVASGGGGVRLCASCPIDVNTWTVTLAPVEGRQPDIVIHGTCGIAAGQTLTYTYSQVTDVQGAVYAPMIVLINPAGCPVEITGWRSL